MEHTSECPLHGQCLDNANRPATFSLQIPYCTIQTCPQSSLMGFLCVVTCTCVEWTQKRHLLPHGEKQLHEESTHFFVGKKEKNIATLAIHIGMIKCLESQACLILGKLRQEDCYKSKASLGYITRLWLKKIYIYNDFKNYCYCYDCVYSWWVGVGKGHSAAFGSRRTTLRPWFSPPTSHGFRKSSTGQQACIASTFRQWVISLPLVICF